MMKDAFPRSKERGLIEAIPAQTCERPETKHLPRSKERGLIEAASRRFCAISHRPFRVQKNAASLKPRQGSCNGGRDAMFPRSKERGLIEANGK